MEGVKKPKGWQMRDPKLQAKILELIEEYNWNITSICAELGLKYNTFSVWLKRNAFFQDKMQEAREKYKNRETKLKISKKEEKRRKDDDLKLLAQEKFKELVEGNYKSVETRKVYVANEETAEGILKQMTVTERTGIPNIQAIIKALDVFDENFNGSGAVGHVKQINFFTIHKEHAILENKE